MKTRYIFVICLLSLIINVASMYNVYFGICSILLILLTVIPQLIINIVKKAKKIEEQDRNLAVRNLADYGSITITRSMNKFAIWFSLAVIYGMAIVFAIIQVNQRDTAAAFITNHFQMGYILQVTQVLSIMGYVFFSVSLILVAIQTICLMRNGELFTRH